MSLTTDLNDELGKVKTQRDELASALHELLGLWSDFTSQEMYGELLREGMEAIDFDAWIDSHDKARAALAKLEESK